MKKLVVCLFLALIQQAAGAQKVYFVYLQTDAQQSFYVKMGGKVYSSSSSGYLILSKLRDSTYSFVVGFPENKFPEQSFTVAVSKKDHGYLLKNFGEKGWGLFDLQTLEVLYAASAATKREEEKKTEVGKVSAFTDILSKAADDPSLKERSVVKEEKKEVVAVVTKDTVAKTVPMVEIVKPEEGKELVKDVAKEPVKEPVRDIVKEQVKEAAKDSVKETLVEPVKEPAKEEIKASQKEIESVQEEEYKRSEVKRRSESSTTEGFGLVFTDDLGNGNIDTIRLLIPEPKSSIVAIVKEEPKEEKKFLNVDSVKAEPVKTEPEAKEIKIVEEVKPVPVQKADTIKVEAILADNGKIDTVKVDAVKTDSVKTDGIKNNCKAVAGQDDFFRLRKSMASVTSDDEMIDEAKKYFRNKCFTTQQVKNLGNLFLSDEGKYRFYDAAYNYVSDPASFPGLQSELKEEYYINRFRAMLR